MAAAITMNGPSGIDDQSLITQLTAIEQQKVTTVQNDQTAYQTKISDYATLSGYLNDLKTKADALNDQSDFNLYSTTSTDDSIVTLTGSTDANEGDYAIDVYQTAATEKLISGAGKITSQTAALSTLGISAGTISVDGTNIAVSSTDTIQDLRMKINNATDSSGNALGVTASVMQVSANDYRLVLTANDSGSTGITYKDVSGTTLEDLGIITDAAGDKGTTSQTISSGSPLPTINTGDIIQYSGVDHNGNTVTGYYTATSSDPSGLLKNIQDTFHGMVNASVDTNGNLVITDNVSGTSQLKINSLVVGSNNVAMNITGVGQNGAGVLSNGRDAYFSLDNINLTSASNEASGIITGVTININKAAAGTEVDTSLTRDVAGIEQKVTDLVNSYNSLLDWTNAETKPADPSDSTSVAGDLAGDMSISMLMDQVEEAFHTDFSQFGWDISSLAQVGVTTDETTGHLSVDSTTFENAVNSNFSGVEQLFTVGGFSTNSNVAYGLSTTDTSSGNYKVKEVDADHIAIQIAGDPTWYTSDARSGSIATFSSGPAKGLTLNVASGILGGQTADFAFSKGIGSVLDDLVTNLTDPNTGIITLQTQSFQTSINDDADQITTLQANVNSYHDNLVQQFANMEEMISSLKSQSANMMSQLGVSTASSTSSSSS